MSERPALWPVRTGLRRSVPLCLRWLWKSHVTQSGKLAKRGRVLEAVGELLEDALSLETILSGLRFAEASHYLPNELPGK